MNYEELFNKVKEFKNIQNILKYSNQNNIFKILKLQNYEIRHSNYLAWLLDPNMGHGKGTEFLENLLKKIGEEEITSFDNVEVHTEYPVDDQFKKKGRIDILIESDEFVCVIENKYGSKEHDNQCQRYKRFIEEKYKDKKVKLVFIYLDIYEPDKKLFEKSLCGYESVTYKELLDNNIIPESINDETNNAILKQYKEILNSKYNILDDSDLSKAIKNILKKKGVLPLILKVCKENKDNIEECNTVWTIQSYLWATCFKRANELIGDIYKELNLKPYNENSIYIAGNYGIYRCIPNANEYNDKFIAISNNLKYKDYKQDGINIFIADKNKAYFTLNLVKKGEFIESVINGDDKGLLNKCIEIINENNFQEKISNILCKR